MQASQLHVITARFNPLRWQTPDRHYRDWVEHMLASGVRLTVVECQYGERDFACNVSPRLNFVGVRASTSAWTKENLLNIGLQRTPEAKYLAWIDADVFFRRSDWAVETVDQLQRYRIVQPWSDCYDLGPNDEHLQHHVSFCRQYLHGDVVGAESWRAPYRFPHPGFAWATTRSVLDWTGGLFEHGGMGSGDHHMALALIGRVEESVPTKAHASYIGHLKRWQHRAQAIVNRRIGYVAGTIEHRFHGRKDRRGYQSRWDIFVKHGFDPETDLKRNTLGVLEWAGNKPELEREWDLYLRSRSEDDNSID